MPDQQYEPTTDDILRCYMQRGGSEEEFNRWLATVEAAAEQRGAIKALLDARHDWYKHADQMEHAPGKYYAGLWMKDRADRITDQMEGDDETH